MKPSIAWLAFLFLGALGPLEALPVIVITTLPDRPVFSYVANGLTQTRSLEPGNRVVLEDGLFSGLGLKKIPLSGGSTYYMARFESSIGLFVLGGDQVLILNQSGRAVGFVLVGPAPVSATLASGNFALGAVSADSTLRVEWGPPDHRQGQELTGGNVYRLLSENPADGSGPIVSLNLWD